MLPLHDPYQLTKENTKTGFKARSVLFTALKFRQADGQVTVLLITAIWDR